MKNYFDFTLTGKKIFPVWLMFMIAIIIPSVYTLFSLVGFDQDWTPYFKYEDMANDNLFIMKLGFKYAGLISVGFIIGGLFLYFYLIKYSIEGIKYQDQQPLFGGRFGDFVWKALSGFFLCIITLGIYSPWYIKKMSEFFVNQSSYKEARFTFLGDGGKLFVYFLLYWLLPIIGYSIIIGILNIDTDKNFFNSFMNQAVTTIIMIPFMYQLYNWMVNIMHKNYHLHWQTEFKPACLKMLGQIGLSLVTFGIYWPMAYLKLYQYFAEKTVAESPEKTLRLGYDLEPLDDFMFMWGQILLTMVTLGIYYPWAITKIGKRVLSKTYSMVEMEQD
jgi:hypothetical protein